jgi:hypothetical protein
MSSAPDRQCPRDFGVSLDSRHIAALRRTVETVRALKAAHVSYIRLAVVINRTYISHHRQRTRQRTSAAGGRETDCAPANNSWEANMATITATLPAVLACPSCPRCGTRMSLIHLFPDKPGYDQRTYECPRCQHEVTEVVQIRKAG